MIRGPHAMRYDVDHKERTRARVLSAAAKSILADGPHPIGVADILGKARLTHGGFYAHFASKDELVVAAIQWMFDEALATLQPFAPATPPAAPPTPYNTRHLPPRPP